MKHGSAVGHILPIHGNISENTQCSTGQQVSTGQKEYEASTVTVVCSVRRWIGFSYRGWGLLQHCLATYKDIIVVSRSVNAPLRHPLRKKPLKLATSAAQ